MERAHTEADPLQEPFAADEEPTADLPDEYTVDRTATTGTDTSGAIVPKALPLAPMPKRRAVGFFAFAACSLIAILLTIERNTQLSRPAAQVTMAPTPSTGDPQLLRISTAGSFNDLREMEERGTRVIQSAVGNREKAEAGAARGVIAFEPGSFITSEKALAAVFIVKRTQAVRGRAVVQWAAYSGSADAGIDFSDASGTVRFADGQGQHAIYVPLRNDLLKEKDETFQVCLRSPRHARVEKKSCAEVTIRDDDAISQT